MPSLEYSRLPETKRVFHLLKRRFQRMIIGLSHHGQTTVHTHFMNAYRVIRRFTLEESRYI